MIENLFYLLNLEVKAVLFLDFCAHEMDRVDSPQNRKLFHWHVINILSYEKPKKTRIIWVYFSLEKYIKENFRSERKFIWFVDCFVFEFKMKKCHLFKGKILPMVLIYQTYQNQLRSWPAESVNFQRGTPIFIGSLIIKFVVNICH